MDLCDLEAVCPTPDFRRQNWSITSTNPKPFDSRFLGEHSTDSERTNEQSLGPALIDSTRTSDED
jgi:hypothetical protein